MASRTFKIVPENDHDRKMLEQLFAYKTFFPEESSIPALPATPDPTFDYRQFFIFMNTDRDGHLAVYTRDEIDAADFDQYIPTADWTDRYYLSAIPSVSETFLDIYQPRNLISFLSYEYPRSAITPAVVGTFFTTIGYSSVADFPDTGMSNRLYLNLETGTTYKWNGTKYVLISDSMNLMKAVAFGNSIAVLSQSTQSSGMQKGIHIANSISDSCMEFTPTTITTYCDAFGIYGRGGATLATMLGDIETHWFNPIGLANYNPYPDIAIGYALVENDIVAGQTVPQMIISIDKWINMVQERWVGVKILLNTPHPSLSYSTPTLKTNYAEIRDYILSLDNNDTIFCSDLISYSEPTDLSIPITYPVQGSRSGTTLTVTSSPVVPLEINSYFFIGASTFYITAFGTGTGDIGTYTVSASGTNTTVTFTHCPFTDNSVHPNVKGTLRNARINADTFSRISNNWLRKKPIVSTNYTLLGSIAAQAPATGTVATGTVTTGLTGGTFVFTAKNPGMLCTFTGNTGVTNFGTFNFGSIAISGVNTISPFLEFEIVSGAEYLKNIFLQARITDSAGQAFRIFTQTETPDAWPEYQNGDVIHYVYPPQGPVSGATAGSISALINYVKFLTKYNSGTIVFRITKQGYYKIS